MKFSVRENIDKRSIFRVGEVYSVSGREVSIKVDVNKNGSHLMYCGQLIKNVSVGGYLKILKGFDVLVVKVESEYLKEIINPAQKVHTLGEENFRILIAKLIGYFDGTEYKKGVKELPLIGNECILLDNESFSIIHKFAKENEECIEIGYLMSDQNVPISISIDKLFASHIGIFGNTGSGKSHTLAKLYKELFDKMIKHKNFQEKSRFVIFDFNGEYSSTNTICTSKAVYNLDSEESDADKIPFLIGDLLRLDTLSILADATEKTQQPFIKRTLRFYNKVTNHKTKEEKQSHLKNILAKYTKDTLLLKDAQKERNILDKLDQILLSGLSEEFQGYSVLDDIEILNNGSIKHLSSNEQYVNADNYKTVFSSLRMSSMLNSFIIPDNPIKEFLIFLNLQLIIDLVHNKAQNDHIHPVIRRLDNLMTEIPNILDIGYKNNIFKNTNIVIINLNDLRTDLKKLIPLIVSLSIYREHKQRNKKSLNYLNLIIDEAHNILSKESKRETESWKDYRLETFEEIIKEGRKFGVFLTLSSQRPSDISTTIVSQLHNYFIHRLVNNKDIEMVEKAVSYLDKLSLESLPILPVGACILSGLIADLPIVMQVNELPKVFQPKSQTINLTNLWKDDIASDVIENINDEVDIDNEDL